MTRSLWIIMLLLCGCALLLAQPNPLSRWAHAIPGDSIDAATGIVQSPDGTYLMCGYTSSWGHGGWDIYVAKLDSFGNSPWWFTYGSVYHDAALAIRHTRDNYYILAGYTQTYQNGPLNAYMLKINSSGVESWDQTYNGTSEEYANDVQQTADGGYVMTGGTFSAGLHSNVFLRKTNAQGIESWLRIINHNDDEGFSVQQTSDSGYIIAGRTTNFQGDGWLIKTDPTGHTTWNRYIGQAGDEEFHAVKQTPDHGYIIAGFSNSELGHNRPYLVKTDTAGHVQWWHTYGQSALTGMFTSVDLLQGNNYIAAGTLAGEMYIVRTDSAGNMRWDESYDNSGTEADCSTMLVTRDACYVMAGYTVTSNRGWDFFVMKTGRDRMTLSAPPQHASVPSDYAFSVFPNPFNSSAILSFVLPRNEAVRIEMYDLSGRQVRTFANREYEPGEHRIAFDGSALPSGIYFARLTTPSFALTQKLMLMK